MNCKRVFGEFSVFGLQVQLFVGYEICNDCLVALLHGRALIEAGILSRGFTDV